MNLNRIIVIFVIIFVAIVLYQFTSKAPGHLHSLPAKTVTIDNQSFTVQVATSSAQQQAGLTIVNSLPQNEGMLFLFTKPGYYSFWMRSMKFPLDIIFINGNKIVSFAENARPAASVNQSPPIFQPQSPADKVLEINAGLVKKYEFKKGDAVNIE